MLCSQGRLVPITKALSLALSNGEFDMDLLQKS